ncbi:MAG: PIN domain-containing protein [Cyanobacteria bacterium P01_F01_bin.153]
MKTVFADTGYWVALLNPKDDLHAKAVQVTQEILPAQIMTTEFVLVELLNGASKRGDRLRAAALKLVEGILADPSVEVVASTTDLFQAAMELYRQRLDKRWSHTDCASFCVMNKRRIVEALAYDYHFEQAGFVALLRD